MGSLKYTFLALVISSPLLYSAAVDDSYPRYKYIVSPVYRMGLPPDLSSHFGPDTVSMNFVVEYRPGSYTSYWLLNVSREEFNSYMRNPAPAHENAIAFEIKALIRELKALSENPPPNYSPEKVIVRSLDINSRLSGLVGPVRVLKITLGLEHWPLDVLQAVAGVKPDVAGETFLSLRRFGVLRRRGPTQHEETNDFDLHLRQVLAPLTFDRYAHMVVGDISVPFLHNTLPPPVVYFSDAHMSEFFKANDVSFMVSWGIGSEEAHDLSFRAYKAQIARGHRPSIDNDLLDNLKKAAGELDLTRVFFVAIEDYVNEQVLEVMAFIDGGSKTNDFYETPAEKRFEALNLRERFPGELIEIHGLAIEPGKRAKALGLSTDAMAIQLLHFIENGGHDATTFMLQADALPARLYQSYGFVEVEGSRELLEKELIIMAATGAQLKTKLRSLFPHLKVKLSPELPNRLTRRTAGPQSDSACFRKLRDFGDD